MLNNFVHIATNALVDNDNNLDASRSVLRLCVDSASTLVILEILHCLKVKQCLNCRLTPSKLHSCYSSKE
jgi:hypothetical protein